MKAEDFYQALKDEGIEAFYGVPDSLLKSLCAYVKDHEGGCRHIIAANEGNAVGLACGHYLSTGKPALVYMQNSGLGNCVNPLLSLADEEVYGLPFLMLIGWRGEPGVNDEPQHIKQGKVTPALLDAMGVRYSVLPEDAAQARGALREAVVYMAEQRRPYAFCVRKGTFSPYRLQHPRVHDCPMGREEAIGEIVPLLPVDSVVVSTTGQISRELYEYRCRRGESHMRDFLTVGSMGHASSIAMGVALSRPEKLVVCLDGDGACLMHMGAMGVIAAAKMPNFKHIVLNNAAHDSVGGQPTVADQVDLVAVARHCGYEQALRVGSPEELRRAIPTLMSAPGTFFLEVRVRCGARADLGRPKERPCDNKEAFMAFLGVKAW